MTNKDTGGPAFPASSYLAKTALECIEHLPVTDAKREILVDAAIDSMRGMTLLDYFAAKAMQAEYHLLERRDQFKTCAEGAYAMADAMLEARK